MVTSAKKKKDSHPEEIQKMYGRRDLLKGIALAGLGAGVAGLLSGMKISEAAINPSQPAIVSQFSQIGDASVVVFQDSSGNIYAIDKGGVTGQVGKIIASGTDAASVIQQTINALPNGGKIFFKSGTYNFTTPVIKIGNGQISLIIEGEPRTVLLLNSASMDRVFGLYNVGNIVIRGIEFNGQKSTYTQSSGGLVLLGNSYVLVENCDIHDFTMNAIWVSSYSGINNKVVVIRNCKLHDIGGVTATSLMNLDACKVLIVSGNEMYNTLLGQGVTNGGQALYLAGNNVQAIINNYIHDCYAYIDVKDVSVAGIETFTIFDSNYIENVPTADSSYSYAITCGQKSIITNNRIVMARSNGVAIGLFKDAGYLIEGNVLDGMNVAGSGIYIRGTTANVVVRNNLIKNFTTFGIYLFESNKNNIIEGNYLTSITSYGIKETSSSARSIIINNDVSTLTYKIGVTTSGHIIKNNIGYVTENKGTATLAAGSTSVVVNHGLATTPNKVIITPQANVGTFWVSNITATSFTINIAAAPAANVNFYWEAEV